MTYEINLENFSGPLKKLLELIEENKYEISTINLGKVTGDFLDYVATLERAEPRLLADFIAVASRLILIKSKNLIPELELTAEEEEDIRDLEDRLKLYKSFKDAEAHIQNLWKEGKHSFVRETSITQGNTIVFYPPSGLSINDLSNAISVLKKEVLENNEEYEKYETINFEERIIDFFERTKGRISKFSDFKTGQEKKEVIILFLALLHLFRDCKVHIEQSGQFSDIIIKCHHE